MIREWLGLPRPEDLPPSISEHDLSKLWRRISGRHEWFISSYNSSAIVDPVWKIIHHLIAIGINARTARARKVTLPDMDMMVTMDFGRPVDWLARLAERFEAVVKPGTRNKGMGGGSLITLIAQRCNFTFGYEGCEAPKRSKLDIDLMKNMHMVKRDGKTWSHDPSPHVETLVTDAAAKRRAFKQKHPLYCRANLSPSPPGSPPPSPPPVVPEGQADDELPLADEEVPAADPPVHIPPPVVDDSAEWRQTVTSEIARLSTGMTDMRSDLARIEDLVRTESEWIRTALESLMRGQTAPAATVPAASRAPSPMPHAPSADAIEEDEGDTDGGTTSGGDERASSSSRTF